MATNNNPYIELDTTESANRKVASYLEEFLKTFPEEKVIFWKGTDEDYDKYNSAIRTPNMEKLKAMILGGAPYNHELIENDSYKYVTRQTAFYSRADIMKMIILRHEHEQVNDEGFRINLADAMGIVCESNCSDIARMLLDAKTPIYRGYHLNIAAEHGSWPVIAEILKDHPDIEINAEDKDGKTPLHLAILGGHKHTVQYLLDKKADPNVTTANGRNGAHLACNASEEILHLVAQYAVDVRARDKDGKTPAIIAAEGGRDACIAILAREGANLDQRDNYGNIPMTIAAGLGHSTTVKELIKNGASFQVTNNLRYDGLEVACLNKRDYVAAVIIRLHPGSDYLDFYLRTSWITWMKLVRDRMTESVKALLDRMVVDTDDGNETHYGVVKTKYLYLNSDKKTPDQDGYVDSHAYFLQRIVNMRNVDIAYHGTIRILVDAKMARFGNAVLGLKMISYILFLLALAYSLIQASYQPIPRETYIGDFPNGLRVFTDIFVVGYFVFNSITESLEFLRVIKFAKQDIKSDKNEREREIELISSAEEEGKEKLDHKSHFGDNKETSFLLIRSINNYFFDKANYFDVTGLLTLFILFILRATAQPVQWVFATITFFINAVRIFKRVVLIPYLGPYSTIIYQILIYDVPLFSSLFGLTLLIFTGGYFISLRTPYTAMGFSNVSLLQDTMRTPGVDNEVQWVFLSGIRVLLEGNIYSDEYLYRNLNWLAACIYLTFLFLTVVVFLNVFIAQLSDTYGSFKRNAERIYAWHRLNFIVQIERTSLLSFCFRRKRQDYILEQKLTKETLLHYYGATTLKKLTRSYCPKDIDISETLSSVREHLMSIEDRLFGKQT